MTYMKTVWQDRIVEKPLTYTQTTNQDNTITLTPSPGTVTQGGTPVTAGAMNNIENRIKDADTAQTPQLTTGTSVAYLVDMPTTVNEITIIPHVESGEEPTLNGLPIFMGDSRIGQGQLTANVPIKLIKLNNSFFVCSGGGATAVIDTAADYFSTEILFTYPLNTLVDNEGNVYGRYSTHSADFKKYSPLGEVLVTKQIEYTPSSPIQSFNYWYNGFIYVHTDSHIYKLDTNLNILETKTLNSNINSNWYLKQSGIRAYPSNQYNYSIDSNEPTIILEDVATGTRQSYIKTIGSYKVTFIINECATNDNYIIGYYATGTSSTAHRHLVVYDWDLNLIVDKDCGTGTTFDYVGIAENFVWYKSSTTTYSTFNIIAGDVNLIYVTPTQFDFRKGKMLYAVYFSSTVSVKTVNKDKMILSKPFLLNVRDVFRQSGKYLMKYNSSDSNNYDFFKLKKVKYKYM